MIETSVHAAIEATADAHPDAIAVRCGGEDLRYAELDSRANRLAKHLIASGTRKGDIVGLCVGRTPDLIVAMLAILKAGCAFLPLDPAYPSERLTHMVAHAGVRSIVTEGGRVDALRSAVSGTAATLILAEDPAVHARPDERIALPLDPNRLAYVIYTSGSTGLPKGVMIEHAALTSYVWAVSAVTPLGVGDRVLQFATINFDAAVEEIFPCLASGATLVLMPPPSTLSLAEFTAFCSAEAITFAVLTTSYWNVLVEHLSYHPGDFPKSLRTVVFGGERAQVRWVEAWCAFAPVAVKLFNAYGPTETTVAVSLYEVPRDFPLRRATVVPVGFALGNADVRVLDPSMSDAPEGQVGELWIGGPCVGRGYLGDEVLTRSKFVALPDRPRGQRYYRSGDLARRDEHGCIEVLGRIDEQVKIRGFLVEPAEVERALCSIEGVKGAFVRARTPDHVTGAAQLIAHVVAPEGLGGRDIRARLRDLLPGHMVPRHVVSVPFLPLKPNGKIDADALPAPVTAATALAEPAPQTALEAMLLLLWRSILDDDALNVDDDFFDAGGDSLAAARMVAAVQANLSAQIYMVSIFEASTVSAFAAYLRRHYGAEVRRRFGGEGTPDGAEETVDEAVVARFREVLVPLGDDERRPDGMVKRNPKAVFVLSAPRCGSTLTRILLGGHPGLFAPPELQLLNFKSLKDRNAFFAGTRLAFYLEGAVRALMEAERLDFAAASEAIDAMSRAGLSTLDLTRRLQQAVSPALIVDKTAAYVLDEAALRAAERDFEEPFYIHLVRDPMAMIASFVETRQDQVFFLHRNDFSPRLLAELVWLVGNENIIALLRDVPAHRQARLRYEDLVARPRDEMARLCAAMGLPFVDGMTGAYDRSSRRMTDPARPGSRMVGDLKFHTKAGIEARSADPARDIAVGPLGEPTLALAARLGYGTPAKPRRHAPPHPSLVPLQTKGSGAPLFLVHGVGGSVANLRPLAGALGADRPVFGLQAPGLEAGGRSHGGIAEQAADYLRAARPLSAGRPLLLGGWSYGGIVAWEMAQQSRSEGGNVALLTLLDSRPPRNLAVERREMVIRFAEDFAAGLGQPDVSLRPELLDGHKPADWAAIAFATLESAGILKPGAVSLRRWSDLLTVYTAHVDAAQAYRPAPYHGAVACFLVDPVPPQPTAFDWAFFARGRWAVHGLPAEHHGCLKPPHVSTWAGKLQRSLSEADA